MRQFGDNHKLTKGFQLTIALVCLVFVLILIGGLQLYAFFISPPIDLERVETFEYQVKSGDTLWTIAERFKPVEMDTREFVYYIRELNDNDGKIFPGQVIKIPKLE